MTPLDAGAGLSGLLFGTVLWWTHDDEAATSGAGPAAIACAVAGLTVLAYGAIGISVFALPMLGFAIAVVVATLVAGMGRIRITVTKNTHEWKTTNTTTYRSTPPPTCNDTLRINTPKVGRTTKELEWQGDNSDENWEIAPTHEEEDTSRRRARTTSKLAVRDLKQAANTPRQTGAIKRATTDERTLGREP